MPFCQVGTGLTHTGFPPTRRPSPAGSAAVSPTTDRAGGEPRPCPALTSLGGRRRSRVEAAGAQRLPGSPGGQHCGDSGGESGTVSGGGSGSAVSPPPHRVPAPHLCGRPLRSTPSSAPSPPLPPRAGDAAARGGKRHWVNAGQWERAGARPCVRHGARMASHHCARDPSLGSLPSAPAPRSAPLRIPPWDRSPRSALLSSVPSVRSPQPRPLSPLPSASVPSVRSPQRPSPRLRPLSPATLSPAPRGPLPSVSLPSAPSPQPHFPRYRFPLGPSPRTAPLRTFPSGSLPSHRSPHRRSLRGRSLQPCPLWVPPLGQLPPAPLAPQAQHRHSPVLITQQSRGGERERRNSDISPPYDKSRWPCERRGGTSRDGCCSS